MKHYTLTASDGSNRGCFDCGQPYLQCRCLEKPEAIVNKTPIFQRGENVSVQGVPGTILEVVYPTYTSATSWNGAPVIVTDYLVQLTDGRVDWFGQESLRSDIS